MESLRVAVVGVGHLGKEHARILKSMADVELVAVVDANNDQAQAIGKKLDCLAFTSHRPLLQLADAVVIAVPTVYHHNVAAEFLRSGIPTLVEKPLAATLEQAQDLVELSRANDVVLQVGHIERFNPAWEKLEALNFQPKYIECERLGSFTGRSGDVGVVLDLMIHDLDLVAALVRSPLKSFDALGMSVFGEPEDIATAHLHFTDGCVASIKASRVNSTPKRTMRIWSPEGFLDVDFARKTLTLTQPSDSVRKHGLDMRRLDPASRAALKDQLFGRHLEVLEMTSAEGPDGLTCELREFVRCVRTNSQPRVRGEEGRDALALATQILTSIRSHAWQCSEAGPCGPSHLPYPVGNLFTPPAARTVAA